jgi:hypothetical protein
MRNKYKNFNTQDEMEILSGQLSPEEMYIAGFLKGFNREILKEWQEEGILDFSVKVI